jgi:hypothetical protein
MAFEPIPLDPLPPEERPAPLPIGGVATGGGPLVEGILCSRQHFNDPMARYCCACGISMVHATHTRVTQSRPPVGVLVLDDGATFVLDRDYVIGREPAGHPLVHSGAAEALVIDDPSTQLSRTHAHVVLDGWDVYVDDLGSSNGTHVAAHGATAWTKVLPGERLALGPGAELHLGGRRFVFESHHRAATSGGPR